MKILIIILFATLLFASCNVNRNTVNYTWTTEIEVDYTDKTKDTIFNIIILNENRTPYFYLQTSTEGFVSKTQIIPCLAVSEAMFYEGTAITCYVKKFKIINQTKTVTKN